MEVSNLKNKAVGIAAIFFYALCWFVDMPSSTIRYIGISLPWLSLIVSIPLGFFFGRKEECHLLNYCYVLTVILYFIAVSFITGSVWQQVPHLAVCICLIAYLDNSSLYEHVKKITVEVESLNEAKEHMDCRYKCLQEQLRTIRNRTSLLLKEQEAYNDYSDEAILLARNRVMRKFCQELIVDLDEFEKIDKDLYG